jgi:CheY-like chemotaxis protein
MTSANPYVILIDDDEDDLEMASTSLSAMGMDSRCFTSGPEAISYLGGIAHYAELPDLIVLDQHMPIHDGREVLLMLKANFRLKFIPVLIYSTVIGERIREALINLGAFDCLVKPCSWKEHTQSMEQICAMVHTLQQATRQAV